MSITNHQYNLIRQQLGENQAVCYDYGNSQITLDGSERQDCDGLVYKGNLYPYSDLSHPRIVEKPSQTSESKAKTDQAVDPNTIIANAVEQGLKLQGIVKDAEDPRDKLTSWLER